MRSPDPAVPTNYVFTGNANASFVLTGGDDGTCASTGCTYRECAWVGQLQYVNTTGVQIIVTFTEQNGAIIVVLTIAAGQTGFSNYSKNIECSTSANKSAKIKVNQPNGELEVICNQCG